jgi:hypothetical protein
VSAYTAALSIHVACGSTGLVLGPVAMFARKRRGLHTRAGEAYHWVYVGLFVSAVALAILDWERVWWLAFVGAGSYTLALRAYLAAKRRRPGWLKTHVVGQGGSYIAMVTALFVVNTGGMFLPAWFLPTLIGSPLVRLGARHAIRARARPQLPAA